MPISSPGGGYADTSKVQSTTRSRQAPASSSLTMDNFMLLLATELQNQDMNNPMSNSEMMQQLTSMATVQSMNTFTELSSTQYALSLMGQEVKVASTDKTGKMEMKTGIIAGVNLSTMKVFLEGSDVEYGLGNVMQIGKVPDPGDDDGNGSNDPDGSNKPDDPDGPNKPDDPDGPNKPDDPDDPNKPDDPSGDDDDKNKSRVSRMSAPDPVKASEASRTDPLTGRTARRVVKDDLPDVKSIQPASYRSSASYAKTYSETRTLRMEYLASDKREALARQYEIPEDKRIILASEDPNRKARGPAVGFSSGTSKEKTTLDPRRI